MNIKNYCYSITTMIACIAALCLYLSGSLASAMNPLGGMSLPTLEDFKTNVIPRDFSGQVMAGGASGCAVGYMMGLKGCVYGAAFGSSVVVYNSAYQIRDQWGINVCIESGKVTYHTRDSILPMFCPHPNHWVYLQRQEEIKKIMTFTIVNGVSFSTNLYAEFNARGLNEKATRGAILRNYFRKGYTLQHRVLEIPFTECLNTVVSTTVTNQDIERNFGNLVGEKLLAPIQECFARYHTPYTVTRLFFDDIRIVASSLAPIANNVPKAEEPLDMYDV